MQRQLSNGKWVDASEKFVTMAAGFQGTTTGEIIARLNAGEEIRYRDDDWYPYIRNNPQKVARSAQQMSVCDCGHSVPQGHAMMTARGTSCTRCYDQMSD